MTWADDLVVAYRDHGLRVHEGAGWRDFGVGEWAYGIPKAALIHQFVWPPQNSDQGAVDMLTHGYDTGSYFLNPPVANAFLGKALDGDVYLIGGRVAQHAGQGVRAVFDNAAADRPPLGDGQNAPGPDDWGGGSFCYFGTEMHHYYEEPFAQYDALVRMCTALCQVFGWSQNRILEHSNHTTRKATDLVALDGNQLRRDIQALLDNKPTDWWDTVDAAAAKALVKAAVAEELTRANVPAAVWGEALASPYGSRTAAARVFLFELREVADQHSRSLTTVTSIAQDVHTDVADVHKDVADVHTDVAAVLAAVKAGGGATHTASYTVKAGDTFDALARKGLLALNPTITDPNSITIGQVLVVPAK